MIRVAINGYGRIGRMAHRVILQWHKDEMEVVAINAGRSTDLKGWMYLLKYDSIYGLLQQDVSVKPSADAIDPSFLGHLVIEGKEIPVYSQKDPAQLPWGKHTVDVVIESTGHFTRAEQLSSHITAGAKAAVLSAPGKGGGVPIYVISVNDDAYSGENIISSASCTTNCIAPPAKVIQDTFGIEKAMMTTIHGYTSDQKLHDGGHKDYRRARAAAVNIIPTSTGATLAAAEALPPLKGIFAGLAIRVPVPVASLADFTFLLKRDTTTEEVNQVLRKASENPVYKGILAVTDDPLVSSDIIGNSHSSIVDLSLTQVVGGNMLKIIAWYDNEYGYANRLVEEAVMVSRPATSTPTPAPETVTPVAASEPAQPTDSFVPQTPIPVAQPEPSYLGEQSFIPPSVVKPSTPVSPPTEQQQPPSTPAQSGVASSDQSGTVASSVTESPVAPPTSQIV
jgi:glyceraldehyde 3-phosphate dehydrogenase